MAVRLRRHCAVRLLPGLALALVAGCGQAGGSAADAMDADEAAAAARAGDDGATLYVDQQVERLAKGSNAEREGYLDQLDICRESGAPVSALSEEDVARIGTERWRMWRDSRRLAWRVDRWDVSQPPNPTRETMCSFKLEQAGMHGYADAGRSLNVDLGSGERTEGEGDPDAGLVAVDRGTVVNDPNDLERARMSGMSGPTRQEVAGQPCDRWQTREGGSVCIWAGGAPWGLGSVGDGVFTAGEAPDPSFIVLAASPAPGGMGDRIETSAFVVGGPLDDTDMIPDAR